VTRRFDLWFNFILTGMIVMTFMPAVHTFADWTSYLLAVAATTLAVWTFGYICYESGRRSGEGKP
jgi:K+-sensing histidine kinase KdpD